MPKAIFIVPMDANNTLDLQLQEGEPLTVATADIMDVKINDSVYQSDESLPDGYDEILQIKPHEYDDADPPNVTLYKLMCLRNTTASRVYGGTVMLAPARGGLPVALALVASSNAKLDVLNTRLRAVSPTNFYGRVPVTVNAATRDTIADKLDELAAKAYFDSRAGVRTALGNAAEDVRVITLASWKRDFWQVLGALFQINSNRIDKMGLRSS